MKKLTSLFILFLAFAFCGWIYEVVLTLIAYGYFENRGFLYGPWLPIYGFGGLMLFVAAGRFVEKPAKPGRVILRTVLIFVAITVLSALFELIASYLLDAVGVGYRTLWFYDGEPFNFDGRVSLIASLRFGVIGVIALYVAVPLWKRFTAVSDKPAVKAINIILIVLFFTDLVLRLIFLMQT